MIELEKMRTLTTDTLCNHSAHRIIEIFLVLQSVHVVPGD